jgi:hypothetical protein
MGGEVARNQFFTDSIISIFMFDPTHRGKRFQLRMYLHLKFDTARILFPQVKVSYVRKGKSYKGF